MLTGAGDNFSSGADLTGGAGGTGPEGKVGSPVGASSSSSTRCASSGEIIGRLQRLPKPTIAAVDGVAVVWRWGWRMACDLVVATDRATFSEAS